MSTLADDTILTRSTQAEARGTVKAYGALSADKQLEPMDIERRSPGPHDVQIDSRSG